MNTMQTQDPANVTIHGALTALYGGDVCRDLNKLTSLIGKLSRTEASLQFLLNCRRHNVTPRFIMNTIRLSRQGHYVSRLLFRLPAHFLQAAIRDGRQRHAVLQKSLDCVWVRLSKTIKDQHDWNNIVSQKDAFYWSLL